jgi:hypothetical protein
MAENITMTRISDLPDLGGSGSGSMMMGGAQPMGNDTYMPMNPHPNPYGIGQPIAGGFPPPIHNPPRNGQAAFPPPYSADIPQQRLPSHDIPMKYQAQDEQLQPNYVPTQKSAADYVQEYQNSTDRKLREYEERKRQEKAASNIFDEYQVPIMVAMLFFVFNLPIVNSTLKQYSFLSIYNSDGNFNAGGLVLKCALFGGVFYSLQKIMKNLAEF